MKFNAAMLISIIHNLYTITKIILKYKILIILRIKPHFVKKNNMQAILKVNNSSIKVIKESKSNTSKITLYF